MGDELNQIPASLVDDVNRDEIILFQNPPNCDRTDGLFPPRARRRGARHNAEDIEAAGGQDGDQIPLLPEDENDEELDDDPGRYSIHSSETYEPGNEPRIYSPAYWGRPIGVVEKGNLDIVDVTYESMDYNQGHSQYRTESLPLNNSESYDNCVKFFLIMAISTMTAMAAFFIDFLITKLSNYKYAFLSAKIDEGIKVYHNESPALLLALGTNMVICLVAGILGVWQPLSTGSGITHIKAYLNGVKIPKLLNCYTLIAKGLGVIFSVVGGLPVGKEGPMIHTGAGLAGGLSQGVGTSINVRTPFFRQFRNDRDKREFVACGAAAGVSAAFGAPIAGVIFAIEEGMSFFNLGILFWLLISSCQSYFVLNILKSYEEGSFGNMSSGGLINFGTFDDASYEAIQFVVFIAMGIFGGLMGALYNHLNKHLTLRRNAHLSTNFWKIYEVAAVSLAVTNVAYYCIINISDCKPEGTDYNPYQMQLYCNDGEYHAGAAIWFETPENCVKDLFHAPIDNYDPWNLTIFVVCYFFLSVLTYGLSISSGLFIPSLLIGAAWGRLVGINVQQWFPNSGDVGKYALIGASAQLAGTVRLCMTICTIMMEATGNLTYSYPIIISCMVATFVGNLFNEGIYEIHTKMAGVPLLPWKAPRAAARFTVSRVMASPVKCMYKRMRVREVVDILENCPHGGFPIVDPIVRDGDQRPDNYGQLRGFMLRHHIVQMILAAYYEDNLNVEVTWESFTAPYPVQSDIDEIYVNEMVKDTAMLDFTKILDPAPTTMKPYQGLDLCYEQFRMVGMRHMVVVNDSFEVVGIVTRKDLYRVEIHNYGLKFKTAIIKGNPNYLKRFLRHPNTPAPFAADDEAQNTSLENAEREDREDVPNANAREDVPNANAREDVPNANAREDVPNANAREDVPNANAREDVPNANAREDVPNANAREDVPNANAREDVPNANAREDVPNANAREDVPNANAREDVPNANAREDVPNANAQEDVPADSLEDVPADPPEDVPAVLEDVPADLRGNVQADAREDAP